MNTTAQGNDISWDRDTFLLWLHLLYQRLILATDLQKADRVYLAFSQLWKLLIKAENTKSLSTEGTSAAPFPLWRWQEGSPCWHPTSLRHWAALTVPRGCRDGVP